MAIGNEALGLHVRLQSGATTGNGTAVNLNGQGREVTVYITGSAGVSAGAVQLEEAPDKDYAGTWAAIGGATTVTASTTKVVRTTGCVGAVRARISTNVADGTVDVDLFVN